MSNFQTGSVTALLANLHAGDPVAQQEIWNRYAEQLVRMAYQRVRVFGNLKNDAEDIVLRAYEDFLKGVSCRSFSTLNDREDVLQILVMLTYRKAAEANRYRLAQKRGGGNVHTESAFDHERESIPSVRIEEITDGRPSPEFALLFHEELLNKLNLLKENTKKDIVLMKLKGFSNDEIADELNLSCRSIQRKLRLINDIWTEQSL